MSSHSRARSHSPARSSSHSHAQGGYYVRPSASRSGSSFFGQSSSRGIFGNSGGSSSYYKRRPRDGYISYLLHKLQRMFKELWYFARRHPVKAFFAVIVPLLSAGGAIHGIMRQFGVNMPMMGGLMGGGKRSMGGSYYGSRGYGGSDGGGGGWMENAGSLMQMAKAFM